MTDWVVEPAEPAEHQEPLRLSVPGDKSVSHRALLFNTLAVSQSGGAAHIFGLLESEDVDRTHRACVQLGAAICRSHGGWEVARGPSTAGALALDCGNSGTTARLLLGALASLGREATLRGDASLSRRPMARVIAPLTAMGATFSPTGQATLPLSIHPGALRGMAWRSSVASAQVKSAVLLAGLGAEGPTEYTEPSPSRDQAEGLRAKGGTSCTG